MCGDTLVQETWWEHHVVAVVPELNAILCIEGDSFSCVCHTATGEDASGCEGIDPKTSVVDWAISIGEEARANRPHDSPHAECVHPHPVHNAEGAVKRMCAVFSLTHFNGLEESTNSTRPVSHSHVHEVLQATRVCKKPSLESLRHLFFD